MDVWMYNMYVCADAYRSCHQLVHRRCRICPSDILVPGVSFRVSICGIRMRILHTRDWRPPTCRNDTPNYRTCVDTRNAEHTSTHLKSRVNKRLRVSGPSQHKNIQTHFLYTRIRAQIHCQPSRRLRAPQCVYLHRSAHNWINKHACTHTIFAECLRHPKRKRLLAVFFFCPFFNDFLCTNEASPALKVAAEGHYPGTGAAST